MLKACHQHLPTRIDPINEALAALSQRPAIRRGLLRKFEELQIQCPVCNEEQSEHVLSNYRSGKASDCYDCNRAYDRLCEVLPPSSNPFQRKIQGNLLGGIRCFGLRPHFVPAAPLLVTWEITAQCNMGSCRHCHIGAGLYRGSGSELTPSEAKGVVDQLAEWGVGGIAFTGGESLLRPDFVDLVAYATRRSLACYMATNGLMLAADTVRALRDAGLSLVHISLDGSKDQTHDRFRGYPGSFQKVLEAIENCHEEGLQVAVAATPTRLNASEIPGILRLADDLQVDWLITYGYIPAWRSGVEPDLSAREKDELWSDLLEEASQCRKTRWLPFSPQLSVFAEVTGRSNGLSTTHYYEPLFTSSYQSMLRASTACMAGRYYLAIKADGTVVPCIFLPEKVGNVRDQELADLWANSQVLADLRDREKIQGLCHGCAYGESCGGCRARARAYTGNYLASDPDCPVAARLQKAARSIHRESVQHDLLTMACLG